MGKDYVKTHPNDNKKPAVPKSMNLTQEQEIAAKDLHHLLKSMELDFTFFDCATALKEYNFNIEVTADRIIGGEYKPWKSSDNARFGGHKSRRSNTVTLRFGEEQLIAEEIKEGIESYNDVIEIIPEATNVKGTEKPAVEYVETEVERQDRIAAEEMKKLKAAEKKAKQAEKKAAKKAEPVVEKVEKKAEKKETFTVTIEEEKPVVAKPAVQQPVAAPQVPQTAQTNMPFSPYQMPQMMPNMMPAMPNMMPQMMPAMPNMMPQMMPTMPNMMPMQPMMNGMQMPMMPYMMQVPGMGMQQVFMMPNGQFMMPQQAMPQQQ